MGGRSTGELLLRNRARARMEGIEQEHEHEHDYERGSSLPGLIQSVAESFQVNSKGCWVKGIEKPDVVEELL